MSDFTFVAFLKLLAALFASLGGATVVILGLSRWFGDFMSQRLLDKYNNKHEKELESLKNKYQGELETTKSDLEKARSQFLRYSEKQFELYNDLWRVLLYTKNQADSLWEEATPEKIPSFSEQIRLTKNAIEDNMLLIEDDHYKQLRELISRFEQFSFGKQKLVDLSGKNQDDLAVTEDQAKITIGQNLEVKKSYDKLLMSIGKSFRKQIKG